MKRNIHRKIASLMLIFTIIFTGTAFSMPVNADDGQEAVRNLNYTLSDINKRTVSTANPSASAGTKAAEYKIIIFGRVGCYNTASTLKSISGSSWVSNKSIEVMFIEEGNTTEDLMKSFVEQNCCSDMIVCPTQNCYGSSIMWDYYRAWNGTASSVTFPVIFYIDENDYIRGMTTGIKTASEVISECQNTCGAKDDIILEPEPVPEIMKIDAVCGQSEARSMMDELNARRTGSSGNTPWYWADDDQTKIEVCGLQPLVYDYNLEKVAMQRAAEIALSFSHTRPNGKSCFSAYLEFDNVGTYAGENIAIGYPTAQAALDAWWEEDKMYAGQGHRRNILGVKSNCAYIGIGHVTVGGTDCWVQEFTSTGSGDNSTAANDANKTFDVEYFRSNIISDTVELPYDDIYGGSTITIPVGGSAALPSVSETIQYSGSGAWGCTVTNSSSWVIADTDIAEISEGNIKGKKEGSTTMSRAASYGGDPLVITIKVTEEEQETGDVKSGTGGTDTAKSGTDKTASALAVGSKKTISGQKYKITKTASGKTAGTVAFIKAKNKTSVTVPATIKIKGKTYKVTQINANAFKGSNIRTVTIGKNVKTIKPKAFSGSKATKIVLKTKLLKKSKVKGCLKGSKIKTVQVKVSTKKKTNKTYVTKYKKIFTKKNAGRKVTVK